MISDLLRYTDLPLPEKRYLPGEGLHPHRDPNGFRLPKFSKTDKKFSEFTWQDSKQYLYAIDLFNNRYWWECHEVLEDLWVELNRSGSGGIFLQGIIQVAAGLLKESRCRHQPAVRLIEKGVSKLETQAGVFLGINIEKFVNSIQDYVSGKTKTVPLVKLEGL